MADKIEGLTVRELLKSTYSKLTERHNPREIILPAGAWAEIANDSDWHRTRAGYMNYQSAGLFRLEGNCWAIARGETCESYVAAPYDSDILALEFMADVHSEQAIPEELRERIRQSTYFENSLIYGLAGGSLAVGGQKFGRQMLKLLKPEMQKFIAQEAEYDSQYYSLSTLSPICRSSVKYKPEFTEFLANSIEAVLKSCE